MNGPDKYAVFGNPIKQSKSPLIHKAFAEQFDHDIQYRAVRVEAGRFAAAATRFFEAGGCGLNITAPFKHDAFDFADQRSLRAERAGAVNTLSRAADGSIHGDTTDGVGLVRDMVANHGWTVQGARVLIIGAGGAVRGVLEPLILERPKEVVIVNRTPARAEALAGEFSDMPGSLIGGGYELWDNRQFDLVINASSAGLAGGMADIPPALLTERSCCYDMIYGPEPTIFMRWAAQQAAWAVADGLGMLVEQAAESFYRWRKVRPETGPVIQHLRELMDGS